MKSTCEWDKIKDFVHDYYLVDGMPLRDVMTLVSELHNFSACERSYKKQLKTWGFTTYRKGSAREPSPQSRRRCKRKPLGRSEPSQSLLPPSRISRPKRNLKDGDAKVIPRCETRTRVDTFPLHHAIQERRNSIVKDLLALGSSTQVQDMRGYSPLHYAIMTENPDMVTTLLEHGADVHQPSSTGNLTPLQLASSCPALLSILFKMRFDICNIFLDGKTRYFIADISDPYPQVTSAISFHYFLGGTAYERLVFGSTMTLFQLLSTPFLFDGSPVCVMIEKILENGANTTDYHPILRDELVPQWKTSLELFLEGSLGIEWVTSSGNSCIVRILELFLTGGADPNTRLGSGELILDYFLRLYLLKEEANLYEIVRILLKTIDFTLERDYSRLLLPILAGSNARTSELMDIVLERGCSPNCVNEMAKTPLMILSTAGSSLGTGTEICERVRLLLKYGAEYFWPSGYGHVVADSFLRQDACWSDEAVRLILQTDMSNRGFEPSIYPYCGEWWLKWRRACKCPGWKFSSKELILYASNPNLARVDKRLNNLALEVLAQYHLLAQQEDYRWGISSLEEHIGEIWMVIEDCRRLSINVREEWHLYEEKLAEELIYT